ncbi:MAG: UDP-N-acetylglucosamine--N-acetylmuramyl-(pentapeptide) pyrophosphoryl-undecaprenol N-acetylglucosamine transferase [Campylobacterota bacterium]|nr:UDP-N-acetylglucosamine--N-acetylmuramyl-(pentapeptide) pyrophosphoryl-undecaprenol N-acetylglucosamine transferase [Campylobacterota bacterium]
MDNTVVVTGGGTGGHLSVAKSFIEEFYNRGYKVIFIGSAIGQDKQWFENEPKLYQKYFLDTKGVVNQNILGKFHSLFLIFKAVVKSRSILKKYNVSKVISVGGFSAASASFAARITDTDFYIHEQNSVVGRLNKISSKWSKELFSSYLNSSKIKDYPIDQKYFGKSRVRENVNTIIFLGGSQGATAINNFALKVAPKLKELNINIIHQTGKNDFVKIKQKYEELDIEVDVFDFSTNLLEKMDKADFAVSRAGASTLWELVALGIPTLFIPYPYAAANHQYFNAKYLLENKLCFLKKEEDLEEDYLLNSINKDIKDISTKLIGSIKKDAVKNIIDIITKR